MKRGVDMRSLDSLKDLDAGLKRFSDIAREILYVTEKEIRQTSEELEYRRRYTERRLEYWRKIHEEAENDETSSRALRKLEETEEYLCRIHYLRKLLTDQQQDYRRQAERLTELVTEESIKARHFLKEKFEQLHAYIAGQSSGAISGFSTLTSRGAEVAAPVGGTSTGVEKISFDGFALPDGFRWVSMDEIDQKEIPDDIKFEKLSYEQMKAGLNTLKDEVLPALKEDPKRDGWYFGELDRKAGRQSQDGQHRVYDAFFGGDHIRLERWEGEPRYGITNGRHRILIARQLGWSAIPAKTVDVPQRR